MPKSNESPSPARSRKFDSSLNPASKLLASRPTVLQSFVSKVDAISFDGIAPSPDHQLQLQDQRPLSPQPLIPASSSQHSPPLSLINSPPLSELASHTDDFPRDTPTIRHLKTSLRSRLKTDSSRNQRFTEDSPRSESSDFRHQTPNQSPQKSSSSPSRYRRPSITASSIKSVATSSYPTPPPSLPVNCLSSTSSPANRCSPASSPFHRFSNLLPEPTPLVSSSNPSSAVSSGDSPESLSAGLVLATLDQDINQTTNTVGADITEGCDAEETDLISSQPYSDKSTLPNDSKLPVDLSELHVPLINFHLSPPKLALWSLEAYDCGPRFEVRDLFVHLITLPLHTALAITKKVPILGRCLDSTPLSQQAEKDRQCVLVTATQIACGLVLASGWKVTKKLLNSS